MRSHLHASGKLHSLLEMKFHGIRSSSLSAAAQGVLGGGTRRTVRGFAQPSSKKTQAGRHLPARGCIPTKALLHTADVWEHFLRPEAGRYRVQNPRLNIRRS